MITGSPHLYQQGGQIKGKSDRLLNAALHQAGAVESKGLAAVLTLNHLAVRSGVSYNYLRGIVSRFSDRYEDLTLLRRNGRKMRAISIPDQPLMAVQRWILREIVSRIPTHPDSYAYERGSSIRACATRHIGAGWLVKLDIENFFESINEKHIYRVFRDAGYVPLVALELARICTRSARRAEHIDERKFASYWKRREIQAYSTGVLGFLPQGAPTSGALANLVTKDLDIRFSDLARQRNMVYTRYADDLTFSTRTPFVREHAVELVGVVRGIMRQFGFSLHERKTRVISPGGRKIVLGLLIDGDRVRLNRDMRRRITENIRGVEKFDLAPHVAYRKFSSIDGFVRHISGLLAFAADIEPEWALANRRRWRAALQSNNWQDFDF